MARLVCALLLLAVATASASESRIVGGWPTIIQQYPSMVQIQRQIIGIWTHRCAGIILTASNVLTSAGCFIGPTIFWKHHRINAGSTYRSVGGQFSGVARVISHPYWDADITREGDIAIAVLETPLQYSNVVQQAAILAHGALIPDNLPTVQLGWGVTFGQEFPHLLSDTLKGKDVYTINNERCALNYAYAPIPRTVTPNMVCAGGREEAGACFGDRGGPLMFNDICIGIISGGISCSNSTFPVIHTAIPSYTNWIVDNVA